MNSNPGRVDARERESLSVFLDSPAWQNVLSTAADQITAIRARALTDPNLDPREQTGVVRALAAVRALIEIPYRRLADSSGHKLTDVLPEEVARLFR